MDFCNIGKSCPNYFVSKIKSTMLEHPRCTIKPNPNMTSLYLYDAVGDVTPHAG